MAKVYDFGNKGKFKVLDDGTVQQQDANGEWATLPGVTVKGNAVYAHGNKIGELGPSNSGQVRYTAQSQTASGRVTQTNRRVPPPPVEPSVVKGYTGPYVDVGGIRVPEYRLNSRSPSGLHSLETSEAAQLLNRTVTDANGDTFHIAATGPLSGAVLDANRNQIGTIEIGPGGFTIIRDTGGNVLGSIALGNDGGLYIHSADNGQRVRINTRPYRGPNSQHATPSGGATQPPPANTSRANTIPASGTTQPLVLDFGDNGVFRLLPSGEVAQWDTNAGQWAALPGITVRNGTVYQNDQSLGQISFDSNGALFRMGDRVATGRAIPFNQWQPPSGGGGSIPGASGSGNARAEFVTQAQPTPPPTGAPATVPGVNPFPLSFGGLPLPGSVNAPHAAVGAAELAAQQGRMIPASFILGQSSGHPYAGLWGFLNGDAFAITNSGDVFQWDPNTGLLSALQGVKVSPSGEVATPQGTGQISQMPGGEIAFNLGGTANVGYKVG